MLASGDGGWFLVTPLNDPISSRLFGCWSCMALTFFGQRWSCLELNEILTSSVGEVDALK